MIDQPIVHLPRRFSDEMIAHARQDAPSEACGILTGSNGNVTAMYRVRNIASNPIVTYQMEAQEQLHVFRELEESGLDIFGFYHSHPANQAYPSLTDFERAFYPKAIYFIISLVDAEPVIRAFKIDQETNRIDELAIV
jgi:proteasome lid subunit RPN8/RPN11